MEICDITDKRLCNGYLYSAVVTGIHIAKICA